jgi:hypothetical protein
MDLHSNLAALFAKFLLQDSDGLWLHNFQFFPNLFEGNMRKGWGAPSKQLLWGGRHCLTNGRSRIWSSAGPVTVGFGGWEKAKWGHFLITIIYEVWINMEEWNYVLKTDYHPIPQSREHRRCSKIEACKTTTEKGMMTEKQMVSVANNCF